MKNGSACIVQYIAKNNHRLRINNSLEIVETFFGEEKNPDILKEILTYIVIKYKEKNQDIFEFPFKCPKFSNCLEIIGEKELEALLTKLMKQV